MKYTQKDKNKNKEVNFDDKATKIIQNPHFAQLLGNIFLNF